MAIGATANTPSPNPAPSPVSEETSDGLIIISDFLEFGSTPEAREWLEQTGLSSDGSFLYPFQVEAANEAQGEDGGMSGFREQVHTILTGDGSLKYVTGRYAYDKYASFVGEDFFRANSISEEVGPIEASFESLLNFLTAGNEQGVVDWAKSPDGQKVVLALLTIIQFQIVSGQIPEGQSAESLLAAAKTLIKIAKGETPSEDEMAQLLPVVQGLQTLLIPPAVSQGAQTNTLNGAQELQGYNAQQLQQRY